MIVTNHVTDDIVLDLSKYIKNNEFDRNSEDDLIRQYAALSSDNKTITVYADKFNKVTKGIIQGLLDLHDPCVNHVICFGNPYHDSASVNYIRLAYERNREVFK